MEENNNQQQNQQNFQQQQNQGMEQWNDVKGKNSGKATTAIIIVLLIIIIGLLGGFIFMKKDVLFSKENTKKEAKTVEKETTKEEEEEKVTFTESELREYVSNIKPINTGPSKIYKEDGKSADSMSAREKIEYVGAKLYAKSTSSADYRYNILTEADVKNFIEEVYGPNTYERTTFNLGCGDYEFRENEGKYYSQTGCGGTTATFASNEIIDYTATKTKLEITTAYALFDGATNKIYKDYDKTQAIADYAGGSTNEVNQYLSQYVKDNKDKLSHLVYTFESSDGEHYYFKQLKNNK